MWKSISVHGEVIEKYKKLKLTKSGSRLKRSLSDRQKLITLTKLWEEVYVTPSNRVLYQHSGSRSMGSLWDTDKLIPITFW